MRRDFTLQTTYRTGLVEEVKSCFGETSAEYGLALAGAPQLKKLLSFYTREHFDAEDLIAVQEANDKGKALISRAEWLQKVRQLEIKVDEALGPAPKMPDYLKG